MTNSSFVSMMWKILGFLWNPVWSSHPDLSRRLSRRIRLSRNHCREYGLFIRAISRATVAHSKSRWIGWPRSTRCCSSHLKSSYLWRPSVVDRGYTQQLVTRRFSDDQTSFLIAIFHLETDIDVFWQFERSNARNIDVDLELRWPMDFSCSCQVAVVENDLGSVSTYVNRRCGWIITFNRLARTKQLRRC